jgi:hypothetical protein
LLNLITLFGIEAAQLILDIEARLPAHVQQVLAFNVQLSSQCINTDFLSLQAELLEETTP